MQTTGKELPGGGSPELEELLDLEEAAEQLCVSKTTLYRMLDRGEVKGVKVGRQWRFRRSDLEAYLTRGPVAVALAAMPVEVLDQEVAALGALLAEAGASVPAVTDDTLDRWEAGVLQVLLCLLKLARVRQVSDIHLEVMRDGDAQAGVVRFRIDGVLHEVYRLPQRVHEALLMRVRLMATGDVGNGSYLDASLHLPVDDELEDLRLSIMPTYLGEALAIRLLAVSGLTQLRLDDLGLHPQELARVRRWTQCPAGLIVVAGPTGCGKTTLLYKLLQEVAGPQRKSATVEDPVEQVLPWVTQVELNQKSQNTASALRAFLRHDVDVIMVGQLRDLETIELAIHAAETGHLTMAPVHVVSAVDTLKRIIDVFPLAQQSTVRAMLAKNTLGVIGLRLARMLCPQCKQPAEISADELAHLHDVALHGGYQLPAEVHFCRPIGCPACGHTGFRGRTGIFEVLEMNAPLRAACLHDAPRDELVQLAIANGMRTLAADGIRKAADGITTLDEVLGLIRQQEQGNGD